MVKEIIKDQVTGGIVNEFNKTRILNEVKELNAQNQALNQALKEIEKVRDFIDKPDNILGSIKTKHGEIAEQVEVGITRAKDILNQKDPSATFEGVGRTAPEDYLKNGIKVQSKFINGTNNNLKSVLEHMDKYKSFGRDGSYYEIPKDTYEVVQKVINGEEVDGLKESTKKAILEKIQKIEEESGKSFNEVIKPGISNYSDVQTGKVEETLDNHEKDLKKENQDKKNIIREEHKPSFNEGVKVAAAAAVVGAALSLTNSLYQKHKNGKKFYKGEISVEEWKEIGIVTIKDGGVAGVTGGVIYGLTNYANMSAPFAAATVSAIKGVGSLVIDYNNGNINEKELMELGLIVCSESAIIGVTSAIGQSIIPVPVLGAVIGSIAGSILISALNFNKKSASAIERELRLNLEKLNETHKKIVKEINQRFQALGDLIEVSFDFQNNFKLFEASIEVARVLGVEDKYIIKTINELDDFMLN